MDGLPSDHLRHFPSDFSIAMWVETWGGVVGRLSCWYTNSSQFRKGWGLWGLQLFGKRFFRLENFSIHSPWKMMSGKRILVASFCRWFLAVFCLKGCRHLDIHFGNLLAFLFKMCWSLLLGSKSLGIEVLSSPVFFFKEKLHQQYTPLAKLLWMVVLSRSWDCENPINEGQNDHIQPVLLDFVHQQYLKAKHINEHISQAV